MDDAALIDEYLQWRAVRELSAPDLTPQAFMQERVKDMAVDRLEDAIKYIDTRLSAVGTPAQKIQLRAIKEILEGTDGQETDRETSEQEPLDVDHILDASRTPNTN